MRQKIGEVKFRNELFKALLRRQEGKKLGHNQKILIAIYEHHKSHPKQYKSYWKKIRKVI
jgi:hypothetical protein